MHPEKCDHFSEYNAKKTRLSEAISKNAGKISLKKKTASNLFRYTPQKQDNSASIKVSDFDNIIAIDPINQTLDVEGLTPYEKIIDATLAHDLLPTVAPELKHITIGGAIVGIGIESSGHQFGFVHDGLLEAEVLLPDGKIVLCKPDNEYADLFYGLPNSYGTLGYILRAKIKLYSALPFVNIQMIRFTDIEKYLSAMQQMALEKTFNFIEGLVFSKNEMYLMLSNFVAYCDKTDDIYHENIFYKLVQQRQNIYLTTKDYIFRYDPDWFWNIPETGLYKLLRKLTPKRWRNSGFYKKYIDIKKSWLTRLRIPQNTHQQQEPLIQDWEVPWDRSSQLLNFALDKINLNGKPWAIVPIYSFHPATLYPLQANTLYFNLGCYCYSQRQADQNDLYANTKLMDDYCFKLGGLKMLYSSTFLTKIEFDRMYNGDQYVKLKQKYDAKKVSDSLYNKVSLLA